MKKKLWTILTAGALTVFLAAFLFYQGLQKFKYPSYKEFPVQGIDISHHQGDIEWSELIKENISFVFIKATEGADFKDPKFQDNWTNSKNTELAVGAYHYYRFCKNGKEQADNFIATVTKTDKSLPPVVDLEFEGNCQTDKTKEQMIGEFKTGLTK